jgi:hypothetical protein
VSNVRSMPLENGSARPARMPWYVKLATGDGIAAAIVWCLGAAATASAVLVMMPDLPWYFAAGFAVVMQGLLTKGQSKLWRGKASMTSLGCVIIDVLFNAGGIYPYAQRLGATPPAIMIADVFGVSSQMGAWGAMIVALALGVLIAGAPEELWTKG